jgi:C4-dicarboxylate-specific signal transduction histidine kinase
VGAAYNESIGSKLRLTIISLLILASVAGAVLVRLVLRTEVVYTHFMYIPITLACTWWGLQGLWVALGLGVVVGLLHVLSGGAGIFVDAARITFFVVVALLVGALKERERRVERARAAAEAEKRAMVELAQRQEQQLEHSTRLAELGEMAAAISHEINQPLTGIRTYARNAYYMLEQSVGGIEDVKKNLRLIADQVDRASRIINQMRELTRRAEPALLPVDVNGVLSESLEFLMPQMKLSEIQVELSLDKELPRTLGDRIRLAQVFLNLLANARQAMEGSPERRLVLRSRHEPAEPGAVPGAAPREGRIVVEIADTGKGFAAEEAEKLFTPFYTTKERGHGTGLGLSISRTIIKDHGGSIEAGGAVGRGATFTVRLPVRAAPERAKSDV